MNEFDIENCDMPIMKSKKRQMIEETELPTNERTVGEKENYRY